MKALRKKKRNELFKKRDLPVSLFEVHLLISKQRIVPQPPAKPGSAFLRLRSQKKNSTEGITQARNATTKIICILLLFSDLETLFSIMTRTREKCNQIASS